MTDAAVAGARDEVGADKRAAAADARRDPRDPFLERAEATACARAAGHVT